MDESRPWWERIPVGAPLLTAFVKLNRAGSPAERQTPNQGDLSQRRVRYVAGVEYIAHQTQAAQPLQWHGDEVTLFFISDETASAPARAFEAAKALRERFIIDLNVPVRLAVHAAVIPWHPEPDKLIHPAIALCASLEHDTPIDGIGLTEDVYLALPETERQHMASLGVMEKEEQFAYVFPASLAAKRDPHAFRASGDHTLWDAFRDSTAPPRDRDQERSGHPQDGPRRAVAHRRQGAQHLSLAARPCALPLKNLPPRTRESQVSDAGSRR